MWNLLNSKLPRLQKGRVITAAAGNAWAEVGERARIILGQQGSRLAVTQLPNGIAVRSQGVASADFLTNSTVGKRVGTTLGAGTGTLQRIIAGEYIDTGQQYDLVSKWSDVEVDPGSYVTANLIDDVWEVIDVDDCGNTTSGRSESWSTPPT